MGMYDTVHFDKPRECPKCGGEIRAIQTKKFEKLLIHYRVGDCVDHAEESRITREKLFCDNCSKHLEKYVYLAVDRGVLLRVTDTGEEAEDLLRTADKEKLLLMYHDLYKKHRKEQKSKRRYKSFLKQARRWFRKEKHEKEKLSPIEKFPLSSKHLVSAETPLQAIENFLSYQELMNALEEFEERGKTTLDIYWLEDINEGEEGWSVDVLQDELNKQCNTNWTWTVLDETQAEADERNKDRLPFWNIVTEEKYSEKAVKKAVRNWLEGKGYEFDIRVITPDEAEGSGLLKKVEELEKRDIDSLDYERLEDL
ncbi:hypothetical protein AKJ50_01330 [candidate division MSBL1 archaeon SCGC-AAA382A13]|uniref:Uncharacterized protein n=1 Tax=candidate division MSBL1 archaeon SCGC-AAA382A13 TaxID=1698279 RepID=A0A133VFT3_9EURY|nr:hypothetical protein AKJ50_01330 [candidate division MSBL1 archaeon SCGC-AAA382A13]